MFKVLLVDDEVFVRKGLQELIDWEQLGYVVAGEAENGEEALAMMESLRPDLVITDIRMPVLDGLELIRSVMETGGLDPIFIIISGYHDFKYAQQALRYGVHDYVLKPIDDEELSAALKKLAGKIGMKRLGALAAEKQMASAVLEMLVQEHPEIGDVNQYAAALGLKALSPYAYAIVEFHYNPDVDAPGIKAVQEVLSHRDKRGEDIPVFEQQPGKYGILITADYLANFGGNLHAGLLSLRSSLLKHLNTPVSLYAGETVHNLAHVRQSYLTAVEASRHKYAQEKEGVILHQQIADKPLHVLDMDQGLFNQLMVQLEENDVAGFTKTINSMFRLFHAQRFAPSAVGNSIRRCVISMIQVIKEMDGGETIPRAMQDMMSWEGRNWSLQRLKEQFIVAMTEAAGYVTQLRKEQAKGGIEKIKKYIDIHYNENISLRSIATKFYMNPVYLGQLFRKSYGVYFNDYLLKLRVQEAKKLLRQTDLRMYEVAERVGFQNADYFVTQFEKLEHMSPTEYRNRLIGKM